MDSIEHKVLLPIPTSGQGLGFLLCFSAAEAIREVLHDFELRGLTILLLTKDSEWSLFTLRVTTARLVYEHAGSEGHVFLCPNLSQGSQRFLCLAVACDSGVKHFQFAAFPFGLRFFSKIQGEALAP